MPLPVAGGPRFFIVTTVVFFINSGNMKASRGEVLSLRPKRGKPSCGNGASRGAGCTHATFSLQSYGCGPARVAGEIACRQESIFVVQAIAFIRISASIIEVVERQSEKLSTVALLGSMHKKYPTWIGKSAKLRRLG
jgi:hypothetical protein